MPQMRKISFFLPAPWVFALMLGIGVVFWAVLAQANIAEPGSDAQPAVTAPAKPSTSTAAQEWRIKIFDAAVVNGEFVRLGEIAEPLGDYPQEKWSELKNLKLWPAPEVIGKPLSINKITLKTQMRTYLEDLERICIYPSSLAIQQGGALVRGEDLHAQAVKYLTRETVGLPGEVDFTDIKTPNYIFLSHSQQTIEPQLISKLGAGRMSLRFVVGDLDGTVLRRYTGSAFVNLWVSVPCASVPLNKEDVVDVDKIKFMRKNVAHLRGNVNDIWDGRGGPYRIMRSIGAEQVIYVSDLSGVPTVRRGATVNLVYDKGNVRLQVQAQAQADAALGESVTVRNLQSKKLITAVVQAGDTVLVN